ncbi:serine hydrolase [Micromonospora avicenniae]|uniref:Beta-lactamase n=1 Tax=Micromonospora avicenniae TaxID=1198245 RepID=A0A1N7DEF4_9ACTN|nr:serine hydrolase [Micromonospora avicenniae]SIR74239.1 Beta-lactamase class A [Micromonospora avicenniae]
MSGRGPSRRGLLAAAVLAITGGGAAGASAVWRLTSGGESASDPEGRAASAARTPSPTPDYLAAARVKIEAYVQRVGNGQVAVAVKDRESDIAVTVGDARFQTASIVKVDILAALLVRAQLRNQKITDSDRRNAKKMITASDNDAATALYHRIGGESGLTTANRTFGMKETNPKASWGMTTTTVADQIRLLTSLTYADGPLDEDGRAYLFDLMSQVEEDQDWGVPAAADPGTTEVYVKNGWDTISADGGLWQVNTIGRLVEPGHDWLVAVLSNHHRTQAAGIRKVEAVAKYTLDELRKIPTAPTA